MFWRFSYSTSQIQCLLEKDVIKFILKFSNFVQIFKIVCILHIPKIKCSLNSSKINIINLRGNTGMVLNITLLFISGSLRHNNISLDVHCVNIFVV